MIVSDCVEDSIEAVKSGDQNSGRGGQKSENFFPTKSNPTA